MNFLNLTNGLLAIRDYGLTDYLYIRIQSTWCEQKRWGPILDALSDDFLVAVASGAPCIVYDYGAQKQVPRAIWQGLEWVKFALHRRWFHADYQPVGRAISMWTYFDRVYRHLPQSTLNRLRYYGKFVNRPPQITAVTGATHLDGKIPVLHGG